jgi:predicted nuclease of predicted toxin-antitoxin system
VLRGAPPKVIWLNIGNANNAETRALLLQHAEAIEQFATHPDAGFLALAFEPRTG